MTIPHANNDLGKTPSANSPVFVVGSARSGTTLLYHILLSSKVFPLYHAESKILVGGRKYGNIASEKARREFLKDFTQSIQFKRSGIEPYQFTEIVNHRCWNYYDVLKFFMDSMAIAQGKKRWAEKTPGHIHYMNEIAERFPSALFIHIIRDGRDVALSCRKLGWGPVAVSSPLVNILLNAAAWNKNVSRGRKAGALLGKDRYLEIFYESLVKNPQEQIRLIEKFIGISISSGIEANEQIGSLRKANSAFQDKISGLSDAPVARWRSNLNHEEIGGIKWLIGDSLEQLGYAWGDFSDLGKPAFSTKMYFSMMWGLASIKHYLKEHTFLGKKAEIPFDFDKR